MATVDTSLEEEELDELGFEEDVLGTDGEAEAAELGFVELVDLEFGGGEVGELLLAELEELGVPSSFPLSLVVSLSLAFSPSFSFSFIACSFAIFSFSAELGFEEALALELASFPELPVLIAADADGEEEAPAAGGSGWQLISCETSWIEKNKRRRKPRLLLTATYLASRLPLGLVWAYED